MTASIVVRGVGRELFSVLARFRPSRASEARQASQKPGVRRGAKAQRSHANDAAAILAAVMVSPPRPGISLAVRDGDAADVVRTVVSTAS